MSLAGAWTWPRKLVTAISGISSLTIVAWLSFSAQIDENDWTLGRTLTSVGISAIAGLVVWTVVQWLLSSRHRILATMARNNLVRRKRNTALVIAGLLVGSAIVSSSLVIGDSLDATMEQHFLVPLGDTDYYIRGNDPITGLWTEWNSTRASELSDELVDMPDIIGARPGLALTISAIHEKSGLAEPNGQWMAFDANRSLLGSFDPIGGENGIHYADIESGNVVINEEMAERVSADVGDTLEVHWMIIDYTSGIEKKSLNMTVQAIISDISTGYLGSKYPLIFTSLSDAQTYTEKTDLVNHIGISVKGDGTTAIRDNLKDAINEKLLAEDAGLTIEADEANGMIAVARTTGFGLLDVGEVANLTAIVDETNADAQILEMLQVPLYNTAQGSVNLSGLASSTITEIAQTEGWDWYATASGLSLQDSFGEWWIWESDADEKAINDLLILSEKKGLVAHSEGLREVDVSPDSNDIDHLNGREIVALEQSESSIFALELDEGAVILHQSDLNLSGWLTFSILDDGSAMRLDMAIDDSQLHIRIERLLGSRSCSFSLENTTNTPLSQFCSDDLVERRNLFSHAGSAWVDNGQSLHLLDNGTLIPANTLGLPNGSILANSESVLWVESEGLWYWNTTNFASYSMPLPPAASTSEAAISMVGARLIVTTGNGVAISDDGELSGRIPNRIKVDALRVPLTAIALSGEGSMGFPDVDDQHVVISKWAGDTLDLDEGEFIRLRGYLPVARGMLTGELMYVDNSNLTFPSPPGQPSFDAISFAVVSLSDAENLASGNSGDRTFVIISGPALFNSTNYTVMESAIIAWSDEQADLQTTNLRVVPIKQRALEATEGAGESFSMLFLIFGSFVIFAGILLVINIFVMLADERKPEMGMARAIGMQRADLRALFVQEGAFLGLISSALGAVLGIGFGWVIMQFMGTALGEAGGRLNGAIFDWTFQSLLGGFVTGFLVTWVTLWLTSLWISRLNVVAAIRDIPVRFTGGLPWWSILISLFLALSSMLFFGLAFLAGSPEDGSRHAWWLLGGFIFLFSLLPPMFWILRVILPENIHFGRIRLHRPVILPRLILTILGTSMVLWGWIGDPISADWEQGAYSFILLGIFLVAAGVLLLSSLAPIVARAIARLLSARSKRAASVLPTSLSYPLATPFRTAMSMGMFSIVVFAVVVLSGYSALLNNYMDDLSEEVGGEYEIVAISGKFDYSLDKDLSNWNLSEASIEDFDSVSFMSTTPVNAERLDGSGDELIVYLRGFDRNFTDHGALSLAAWDEFFGETEAELWSAVFNDSYLAIVDYSLTPQPAGGIDTAPTLNLQIGDSVVVSDPLNKGINRTVYVAGILTPSSSFFMSGIHISADFAEERFDAEPKLALFSVSSDIDETRQQELADEIERGMAEDQVSTVVIGVFFAKLQSFVLSMFDLLQAFLALGLAVGIAGLAVITIRNVSERRHQIGILRALGFQRGMVVASFLIELTWVSFLGILNGAIVGVGFHYALYDRFLREEGAEFLMPWGEISLVVFGAYILTLISTIWPVLKAASISPAEALRDVQ